MKLVKKYLYTPGPLTRMEDKIGKYLLKGGVEITDGEHTYKPYGSVYPDVYTGYEDINNPENPLLIDEYYNEDGEQHVRKKAIPYEALNKVFVRDDGLIILADDLDLYTYYFNDKDRLLKTPKYHTEVKRLPYHDTFRDYKITRDEYGNTVGTPKLIGTDDWLDPSEGAGNDIYATIAGLGRLVTNGLPKIVEKTVTPTIEQLQVAATNRVPSNAFGKAGLVMTKALDYTLPSHYLKGSLPTALGGHGNLIGATLDNAAAAHMITSAYNELKNNPNIGTATNMGLAALPLLPFRTVTEAVLAGKNVLSLSSEAELIDEIMRLYPHLTSKEALATLNLMKKYLANPETLGSLVGLHPLLVEEARLRTKKLNPIPFKPKDFGFPETPEKQITGDVTHINEPILSPFGSGYRSWYNHTDGSDAGFFIDGEHSIITPILRPSYDTGIVNRSVLIPMVREITRMMKNPMFKDYMITADTSYTPSTYDLFGSNYKGILDFPYSELSFDSWELLHKLINKHNLDYMFIPSEANFNDMAKVNEQLSEAFLKYKRGTLTPDETNLFLNDFYKYLELSKSEPSIRGSKSGRFIVGHPVGIINAHKKGSKLIRRKKKW